MKTSLFQKNRLPTLLATIFIVVCFFIIPTEVQAGPIEWAVNKVKGFVVDLILVPFSIAGWFVGIAGSLLNAVIEYTIINLRDNLRNISTINLVWSVIRDLANLSFIFILLYAAIQTIIGQGDGKMKSLIVKIVIAAILINFSMFFTRVAIDTSNLVALTLYKPIAECVGGSTLTDKRGLSDCFTQHMGITTIFGGGEELMGSLNKSFTAAAILSIAGTIFFVITAFAFFAVSIMLLVRYVNFIYLLIASPLGVVGTIIPSLGGQATKWKQRLIAECTFAPVYMLATWVVLTIMQGLGSTLTSGAQLSDLTTATPSVNPVDNVGLIINFGILIALILGSIIIAKQTANHAGSYGETVIKKGLGLLGGAAAGTGGFFGRRVLGRTGQALSENAKLKEAASKGGFQGLVARTALKTTRSAGEGSWDFRSSRAFEQYNKGAKAFGGEVLDFGKAGGKGGIKQKMDDEVKAEKKFAESLKTTPLEKRRFENELEAVKKVNTTEDKKFQQKHIEDLRGWKSESVNDHRTWVNKTNEYLRLESRMSDTQKAEYRKELERLKEKAEESSRKSNLTDIEKYKEERIRQAKENLDNITGINAEEAKRRRIDAMMAADPTLTKEAAKNELNRKINAGEETLSTLDGADARRQKQYATSREERMFISPGRVGFVGKVSREALSSAAAIRKQAGEKSDAQKFADLAKKIAEDDLKEKGVDPGATSTTPPPTGGPSPAGGTPPPSP